jgi:hypothetical protein
MAIIIIGQNLVYLGIGLYYHINNEYISQQLCINRNNPQLHCNGRCYLSKQLKKAEAGENKSSQIIKEKYEMIAFYSHDGQPSLMPGLLFVSCTGNYVNCQLPPIPRFVPDQPPQA